MQKKHLTILLTLPVVILLAACSFQLPWAKSTSSNAVAQNQQNPAANFASQPVESKLAIGTLKLEGTNQAVTIEQAKTLLPLWKAVKSLSTGSNTTNDEMSALYQQIQEAMTAEQVQTIKDLNLSQTDLQALMQQYGVQFPQGGPNAGAGASGTPSANSSKSSGSNAGNAGGGQGGFPGGAGGPPPDLGGGGPIGGAPSGGSSSQAQRTPQAGVANRGPRGGGMNLMLVDPLIKLLEQRAGA